MVPSIYEGFGLPAGEAMACGVPVVASDVGMHREIITHGEDGFLVPEGGDWQAPVRALAQDLELRKQVGAAARRKVSAEYGQRQTTNRMLRALGVIK